MSDLDLESFDDIPSRAPARSTRFLPKGAKLKQPKPEPGGVSSSSVTAAAGGGVKPSDDDVAPMEVDGEPKPVELPQDEITKDVSMEEDGEDPVVREIDVYFTRPSDPNNKLCVLQYPLRPSWRPYDMEDKCKEVRVKSDKPDAPITAVEVDLEVDRNPNNYDKNVERALRIKTQTLESKWMLPKSTTYAVGVLKGNKLHINPIDAVFQLRPSMKHVKFGLPDAGDSSDDEDAAAAQVKSEEGTSKKSGGSSKKQVPVKSKAPSNEQNKDTEETWLSLEYHGKNSFTSAECLRDMSRQDDTPLQFSMSRSDYVNSLCSITPSGDKGSKGLWERISPTVKGPWQQCLEEWLVEGPPIHRFCTLRHIAPDVSEAEFIVELQKHAVLVRGLWVPRTSLLYKQDADLTKKVARDYILGLFTENEVIGNSELPTKPQLLQTMRGELGKVAFERTLLGDWKFREQTDSRFIKEHEKIYAEEMEAWKGVKERSAATIGVKQRPVMKTSSKPATPNNPLLSSSAQTSKISTGVDTRMPMPDETREALTQALQKLFHTLKVCSANQIRQRLRDMAVSESYKPKGSKEALIAALGGDNSSQELQAVINEVCVNVHGVYVPRSSPDNPEYDEFRKVVIDLFLADIPNAKIRKAAIKEAAKVSLSRDIKDTEFLKVVQELCVSQGGAWVLKSGDGSSSK